jgi:hypothetical protein
MIIDIIEAKGTEKHFLGSGNQLPNTEIQYKENPQEKNMDTHQLEGEPEHLHDIKTLTKTELMEKYIGEYYSHKNMKQRRNKGTAILSPEFEDFSDFLAIVGPKYHDHYTLDRLDNDNLVYGPGLVEWRDKHAQNSNKSNNVYLTHDDGRKHTIAQWAKIRGQKADALYKRKKSGWTDMEIINGEREHPPTDPLDMTPWPYKKREQWERHYQKIASQTPRLSRIELLYLTAKSEIQRLTQRAIDLSEQQEHYPEDQMCTEEYRDCMERLERFKDILCEAQQQYDYERRMETFIRRSGGDDPAKEKAIFSRMNKRPPFTINRKPE